MVGCYVHGNEPSVSVRDVEFLDCLSDIPSQEGLSSMELVSRVMHKMQTYFLYIKYYLTYFIRQSGIYFVFIITNINNAN